MSKKLEKDNNKRNIKKKKIVYLKFHTKSDKLQ